jgi:hypothetical protein
MQYIVFEREADRDIWSSSEYYGFRESCTAIEREFLQDSLPNSKEITMSISSIILRRVDYTTRMEIEQIFDTTITCACLAIVDLELNYFGNLLKT